MCTWPNTFVEHDHEDATSFKNFTKRSIVISGKKRRLLCTPKNVLIAMINDDNVTVRELEFRRILKARRESEETPKNSSTILQFEVPESNINAEHYSELLHWERDHQRTEPPITMAISKEQLYACIRDEKKLDEKLFHFPCHTQAVERCIKLVTEAFSKVNGRDSRDGFVLATIESRRKMPRLESKKDLI